MLPIYKYSSSSEFLKDAWQLKKLSNPKFSMRSWAKNLGLEGHAHLQRILAGKAKVSKKYVPNFIKSLNLNTKEGMFLDALIDYERAKTTDEKELHSERLKELSPKNKVTIHELESFRFLKDPMHTLMLEMTDLEDFKYDLRWIQKKIHLKKTLKEISEVINRLITLSLLKEDGEILKKTHSHSSNIVDIESKGVQEYHKNVSLLAHDSIKQAVENREYNAYALNLNPEDIPLAKDMIRGFIKDFMQRFENKPGCGVNTYQLNLQLFELTKRRNS